MAILKSEMAGTVLSIDVKVGDQVSVGQEVAVLESMKMEVPLNSSLSGTVSKLLRNTGDFVNEGDGILELS